MTIDTIEICNSFQKFYNYQKINSVSEFSAENR